MIFDFHETELKARDAIAESALRHGEQVRKFQTVAFLPDLSTALPVQEPQPSNQAVMRLAAIAEVAAATFGESPVMCRLKRDFEAALAATPKPK